MEVEVHAVSGKHSVASEVFFFASNFPIFGHLLLKQVVRNNASGVWIKSSGLFFKAKNHNWENYKTVSDH